MTRLKGKTALVTGAGRGIGRAIAVAYAREGAAVAVTDLELDAARETAQEITKAKGIALPLELDVSKADHIDRAVSETVGRFGSIDVLVNNAGIVKSSDFVELTGELLDWHFNVNVKGLIEVSKRVVMEMMKQGGGRIINMSSISEKIVASRQSHYAATKGAVKMLTRGMAVELAKYNILVNAISPGIIETRINKNLLADPARSAYALGRIPLNRPGKPEEVAGAAVFFASDDAGYVTGTTIFVDGGLTANR
ncbi:MAG: SDR family NAD(P)-dependent oxidoreductase [Deltaproteobacteria bacterium]